MPQKGHRKIPQSDATVRKPAPHFGEQPGGEMKIYNWAFALMSMLAVLATSASAAELPTDTDNDGISDENDTCPNQTALPSGSAVKSDGCAKDWGICYLQQLQAGDMVDSCGVRPADFTWHQEMYWGELQNTRVRLDRHDRWVRTGPFNGTWHQEKGRFVQVTNDLLGYEGSGVYKDHKRLGATVLRSDSPMFWSNVDRRVKGVSHPITASEVAGLKAGAAEAWKAYGKAKKYYEDMEKTRSADAKELEDAKKELEKSTSVYNKTAGELSDMSRDLGELERIVGVDGDSGLRGDVATLKLKGEQNKFFLEAGYSFVGETWFGVLPGGLILDLAPSHRILIGAGHQFRSDRVTVRGVLQGGLNLRYDASSAGATVGGRVDAFYQFRKLPEGLRFGGSLGVDVDWYHLSHGRTSEGVYSFATSFRWVFKGGVAFDLGNSPLTLTVTGGVRTGPTWVGIKGVDTPAWRGGPEVSVKIGGPIGGP